MGVEVEAGSRRFCRMVDDSNSNTAGENMDHFTIQPGNEEKTWASED
jgi:hypothetical protein